MAFSSTSLWIIPATTSISLLASSASPSMRLQSVSASMTALQSAMTVSRSSIRMPSASRNSSFIRCTYRWGVAHLLSPLNLALHCHTVHLYLLFGMPHLGAEVFPAVPAFQLCGKHAAAVIEHCISYT